MPSFLEGQLVSNKELQQKGIKSQSTLEKIGSFIAPTTTGLLTGEKDLSLRTAAGAGLEIGSLLLPAGAVARGIGLGGKALSRIAPSIFKGSAKAAATQAPEALGIGQRVGQVAGQIGGQAKTAAQVGGVSGAMFGAGRALGEEETPLTQVAGQAAIGGAAGAVGGAILAPATSLAFMSTRGITRSVSNAIKAVNRNLRPAETQALQQSLREAYITGFAEKQAVRTQLDKVVTRWRKRGGPQTIDDAAGELADNGFVPVVEKDKFANMTGVMDEISDRSNKMVDEIDVSLKPFKQKFSLNSLKQSIIREVQNDAASVDSDKIIKNLDNVFASFKRRFGTSITPIQVNAIRKEMNKKGRGFMKEAFVADTQFYIADGTRKVLDTINPSIRSANADISRLIRLQQIAKIFHNKPIDVGEFPAAFGRYAGTIMGTGALTSIGGVVAGVAGLSITGGTLVLAGLAASMGGKMVAAWIRNMKFNPAVQTAVRQAIQSQKGLVEKLVREAEGKDKELLRRVFKIGRGLMP